MGGSTVLHVVSGSVGSDVQICGVPHECQIPQMFCACANDVRDIVKRECTNH